MHMLQAAGCTHMHAHPLKHPMQAMMVLGDMVAGHPGNQEAMAGAFVHVLGQPQPQPVLDVALHVALHGEDWDEAAAAQHLLASFCLDNPRGQGMLASTITVPGDCHPVSLRGGGRGRRERAACRCNVF